MAEKRFVEVFGQSGFIDPAVKILTDTQTGVQYLFVQSGYAGGLTPLLGRDGKPVIGAIPPVQE